MGAAAAFNLAAACWALADGILPASGGAGAAAIPGIDLLRAPRPARPAAAVATCLAFGGVDAAFVVGRA
jgi:3-oxoacyl-(acyl-carrier-protein) synthase